MNTLTIQSCFQQPDDLVLFPDFIISTMLRIGPSLVEADAFSKEDGIIPFWLKEHGTTERKIIGRLTPDVFRPLLARFAKFSGVENLYCGHVLFACESEREGRVRLHRFSLFLCNEPTQSYWLRLYLYGIDSLFPFKRH
jgi:hypothetical protein